MILRQNGRPVLPLGMYELPRDDSEWRDWSAAGINLVCCHTREQLDMAHRYGMLAWVPVPMILKDGDDGSALAATVEALGDHPALAVWEAPDEAIWWAWRLKPGQPTRFWQQTPEVAAELHAKMDAIIRGLARGAAIIRERDPGRPIWLNEATGSDGDSLSRCLPSLDIVGFDYYPVPNLIDRPMQLLGRVCDRFRRRAPHHELWAVEQAFSWPSLGGTYADRPVAYPTRAEFRFMAWQAIAHGATGINWWGSSHEKRPAPFLADLMAVVAELRDVQPFLVVGDAASVSVSLDEKTMPSLMGVACLCRRTEDGRTMLALINEDGYAHDATVAGLDWVDPAAMRPVVGPDGAFVRTSRGAVTQLEGYEVRVYVGG